MSNKPAASAKRCLATICLLAGLSSCSEPLPGATREQPYFLSAGVIYFADTLPGSRVFHVVEVSPDHGHPWFVSPANPPPPLPPPPSTTPSPTPSQTPPTPPTPGLHTLKDVAQVATENNLLVCMNATYFLADSFYLPRPGHPAVATALAFTGQMPAYVPADTRAVLFDARGRVKIIDARPPWDLDSLVDDAGAPFVPAAGIGGFVFALSDGQINQYQPTNHDRRTLLGVHEPTSRVWLAVFDSAGVPEAAQALQKLGASHVLVLDGGNSTQMAVRMPHKAEHLIPPRPLLGGYISPVATHIGLYASSATPENIDTSSKP